MLITYKDLKIRDANPKDAEILYTWWNDGKVMAHAGFPNGLGITKEQIVEQVSKDSDETGRRLIIEHLESPIGEMSYRNKGDGIAEIGIKICESSKQNNGWGTKLLVVFIQSLFKDYGYQQIILDTNLNNKRAQHVYEKIGFKKVQVKMDAWKDQLGHLQSVVDYALNPVDLNNYIELNMKEYSLKNGDHYTIRPTIISDAKGLIKYLNTIADESDNLTFGKGEVTITEEAEVGFIERVSNSDNQLFIVAEKDERIIGNLCFTAASKPRLAHVGEFGVSVLKEYWGNGVAGYLIEYLLTWAEETSKITKINLQVREDNANAISLYKKYGFEVEGLTTRSFYIDGEYYNSYHMGKLVDKK